MTCKTCGTEIADRALICYRCGAPTVEPKLKPPAPAARRGSTLLGLLAFIVLTLAAIYLGQVASDDVPAPVVWVMVALAAVIAVWRAVRRR